jgi:hypothetical protein
VEGHKHRDKSWATKKLQWLKVVEEQERLGLGHPIGVKAVAALSRVKGKEEWRQVGGLGDVLQEGATERLDRDGRITHDGLAAVVERRLAFYRPKRKEAKPAAPSYGQYVVDRKKMEAAGLRADEGSHAVMFETLERGLPRDHLLAVCREKRQLPRGEDLLAQLTGDDLDGMLEDLQSLAKEQQDDKALLDRLEKNKTELKERTRPLAGLKEEIRKDEEEARKKGLIARKKAKEETPPGEELENEILDHLADARKAQGLSLDSEEWPQPEEAGEQVELLTSIKEEAAACRDGAIKVLNKADELLAAAGEGPEPEEVPEK